MAHRNRSPNPADFADQGIILDEEQAFQRMVDGRWQPDDVFIPAEADRWAEEHGVHARPERFQSGNLPDQPEGLPVRATGESGRPFSF